MGPIDQGCDNLQLSLACTVVTGFSRPVFALYSGSSLYILNCGLECGGTQPASVAVVDPVSLAIIQNIPVDGATVALISGSTMYVAGTPPPATPGGNTCTGGPTTAATTCGRLDLIDIPSLTVTNTQPIYIPDGFHDRIDNFLLARTRAPPSAT